MRKLPVTTRITIEWVNQDGNVFDEETTVTHADLDRETADQMYQSLLTSDFLKESPYYYSPFLYKPAGEIRYLAEFAGAIERGTIDIEDLQRVAVVSNETGNPLDVPLHVTLFDYDPETKTWPFREQQTLEF